MMGHLASKFTMAPPERELRAALIINRFTRSLAIMFATNSVAEVLGLEPSELQHKSFYECIQDNCLDDAMECIEAAKANDSIAYLRFWSRDARREEDIPDESSVADEDLGGDTMAGESSGSADGLQVSGSDSANRDSTPRRNSSDSEQGGVRLDVGMDLDSPVQSASPIKRELSSQEPQGARISSNGQGSSGSNSHQESAAQSSASDTDQAVSPNRRNGSFQPRQQRRLYPIPPVEIEAFISCTSDGLVVILRRARELPTNAAAPAMAESNRQSIFAAPWAPQPVAAHYGPAAHHVPSAHQAPVQEPVKATGGPPLDQLMSSIQEVAVFAWALVGINRNLSSYSHGSPTGHAQPDKDLYYAQQSSEAAMPAFGAQQNGDTTHNTPWDTSSQYPVFGFNMSDKGQPVEPRYTSYPEQGANQLRSNGPWSNGTAGGWSTQQQTLKGQQPPFNGHSPGQQYMGGYQNGTTWGQGANGHDGGSDSGYQSNHRY